MQRIFHPIGQGAFYSERIYDLKMVYDCGVWSADSNSKRVELLINAAYPSGSKINIIFLSHFDFDHVCKIPYLLKRCKVERLVIPLIEKSEKKFIAAFYKIIGDNDLSSFVENTDQFIRLNGLETKLSTVSFNESENREPNDDYTEIQSLSNMVTSGTRIRYSNPEVKIGYREWLFIPHNFRHDERQHTLMNLIAENSVDLDKLLSDPDYLDSQRSTMKNIYNSLSGGINTNSMFLYSGPSNSTENLQWNRVYAGSGYCFCKKFISNRAGCIYTGDGDLKKVKIRNVYRNNFKYVGTIQIPHHGAIGSFDEDTFDIDPVFCPISFGVNNHFGHPSSYVVSSIIEKGMIPMYITEKADSLQIIEAVV